MKHELVVLDVAAGGKMDAQSGLQMKRPRVYGTLAGQSKGKIGAIIMHPTSNFMDHFLLEPLADRGIGALGLNSRYVGNDSVLQMEYVIQDLGAGMEFMRARFDKVFLIGYSGGAALCSFYQAQAECLSITDTPAGDPVVIRPGQLLPADGVVLMGAHLGRSRLMLEWMDASVVDESDPLSRVPELDIYDASRRPPFSAEFVERVTAAQRARRRRITERSLNRLAHLRSIEGGPRDEAMIVYRTYADPRFIDLSLDPNDRAPGGNRGDNPREMNYGVNSLGRYSSLTAWLSQWSELSRADGPENIMRTTVPVLNLELSADGSVFPSAIKEWSAAIRSHGRDAREEYHKLDKATHYLVGQQSHIERVAEFCQSWAQSRL